MPEIGHQKPGIYCCTLLQVWQALFLCGDSDYFWHSACNSSLLLCLDDYLFKKNANRGHYTKLALLRGVSDTTELDSAVSMAPLIRICGFCFEYVHEIEIIFDNTKIYMNKGSRWVRFMQNRDTNLLTLSF